MVAFGLILLLCFTQSLGQSEQDVWMAMEPFSDRPMLAMMSGIYDDKLYLVGGHQTKVSILNINDIYMNTFDDRIYQPDLNVQNANWETQRYWYTLPWGIFCTQKCSTQIDGDDKIYIVSPTRNISGIISNPGWLMIYDMKQYAFRTLQKYNNILPRPVEGACILNNNSHIFVVGGGYQSWYSKSIMIVKICVLAIHIIYMYTIRFVIV